MKWWSKFWKLRRQDDRVKIISLFYLAGVFFVGSTLYTGIHLYKSVEAPAEYVLSISSENGVTDAQLKEIREQDGVIAVGRQMETGVVLNWKGIEIPFTCLKISKEYMEKCYDIETSGAMKKFYLNEGAREQIAEAVKEVKSNILNIDEITADYQIEAGEGIAETGKAKLESLQNGTDMEGSYLVYPSDSAEFAGGAEAVRVRTKNQDLDGQQLAQFQKLGFQVENAEQRKQEALRQELELLRIRYQAITVVICVIAAECLRKWRRL